jgi:hypothetical protein
VLAVRQEITAGRAAFAGGDHALTRAVGIHDEDLIALIAWPGGLENEPLAIGGPIGFRVLAAMGKLNDFGEVIRLGCKQQSATPKQQEEFHGYFNYTET